MRRDVSFLAQGNRAPTEWRQSMNANDVEEGRRRSSWRHWRKSRNVAKVRPDAPSLSHAATNKRSLWRKPKAAASMTPASGEDKSTLPRASRKRRSSTAHASVAQAQGISAGGKTKADLYQVLDELLSLVREERDTLLLDALQRHAQTILHVRGGVGETVLHWRR